MYSSRKGSLDRAKSTTTCITSLHVGGKSGFQFGGCQILPLYGIAKTNCPSPLKHICAFVRNDEKGLVAMLLPKLLTTVFMIYCYPPDIYVICYNTQRQSRKTKLPQPCETMHIPGYIETQRSWQQHTWEKFEKTFKVSSSTHFPICDGFLCRMLG